MEANDPTVTYAGWVYKEGSLVKNWKKRFLVVKRRELAYYKTTDHTSQRAQLMGAMRVHRVERARGITNGLLVSSMEGRQLKIFMDTASECDRCYNAIVEWCHAGASTVAGGATARSPVGSAVRSPVGSTTRSSYSEERGSLHAASSVSVSASGTRMAGWLEKQGQKMPTWKRRYFVLEDGILTYSAHEGGPSLSRHRVVGVRRDRTRPFTMELTLDTGRELRVSGSTEHEVAEWQRVIRQSLNVSPVNRSSQGQQDRPSGGDLRQTLTAGDGNKPSYLNLFGGDPNDESPRDRTSNYSFGANIRLDFDGENQSFIECKDDGEPLENAKPYVKPYSPKAPGVDTIRKMRIEQHLLDDDSDDITITRVSSTQPSGSGSPVPSRRPKDFSKAKADEKPVPPGPCCCIVM